VTVALDSSGGKPGLRTTAVGAGSAAGTAAPGGVVAQAPAAPAPQPGSCTIGEAGNAVQVTLTTTEVPAACTSLAQQLAQSSGGFWQAEFVNAIARSGLCDDA
jgi:hypothetical protein